MLEESMRLNGLPDERLPLLGDDGRVWDGHHRIVAARSLGWRWLPVEFWEV